MKNKNISLDPIKLNGYIEQVGYEKDTILSEWRSKTELLGDVAVMQIGQTQGSLIEILCQLGQFNKCIEIGVFTGYSAICIAKGLPESGKLYALENSTEFNDIAKEYWVKSNCNNKMTNPLELRLVYEPELFWESDRKLRASLQKAAAPHDLARPSWYFVDIR